MRRTIFCLTAVLISACSSSSSNQGPGDAGADSTTTDTGSQPVDSGSPTDSGRDSGSDSGGATTTIAQARAGNVTTPITVLAVVTAVRGDNAMDTKEWYIEDPAGGANSGVAVYCNKTGMPACPGSITPPSRQDLVLVTGTLSNFRGKLELDPTAETMMMSNAPLPPVATVQASDLLSSAMSMYRGVLVQFTNKLTVDDVTPAALYDTQCMMMMGGDAGATDGGDDGAAAEGGPGDAGVVDAGPPFCSGCQPPTYLGFQAHDSMNNEVLIENHFYTTEHLQNSPECLTQTGAVPVTDGMTFSKMGGILDFDPFGMVQVLSPVVDSDYTTP